MGSNGWYQKKGKLGRGIPGKTEAFTTFGSAVSRLQMILLNSEFPGPEVLSLFLKAYRSVSDWSAWRSTTELENGYDPTSHRRPLEMGRMSPVVK